jgi:hypothetical protein
LTHRALGRRAALQDHRCEFPSAVFKPGRASQIRQQKGRERGDRERFQSCPRRGPDPSSRGSSVPPGPDMDDVLMPRSAHSKTEDLQPHDRASGTQSVPIAANCCYFHEACQTEQTSSTGLRGRAVKQR